MTEHDTQLARPIAPSVRHDGWTPERQRAFLAALAETGTVEESARAAGMSASSAYALRRRAEGGVFHLGWEAALLHARRRLADTLMSRAFHGQEETITRGDGTTHVRHRYDNRLALSLLGRLDRLTSEDKGEAPATRLIAQEFDQYLDLVEAGAGPARCGLFLAARSAGDGAVPLPDTVHGLARADLYHRMGVGLPVEIDIRDLDLAARAGWSAEQWQRAEAAGLLAPVPPGPSELPELHPRDDTPPDDGNDAGDAAGKPEPEGVMAHRHPPMWRNGCRYGSPFEHYDGADRSWRTSFPPPPGFRGREVGEYGDPDYERVLSPREEAVIENDERKEFARIERLDVAARDAWFGFVADLPPEEADAPDAPDAPEEDVTDLPDASDLPDVPEGPDASDTPDVHDVPDMPDAPTLLPACRPPQSG